MPGHTPMLPRAAPGSGDRAFGRRFLAAFTLFSPAPRRAAREAFLAHARLYLPAMLGRPFSRLASIARQGRRRRSILGRQTEAIRAVDHHILRCSPLNTGRDGCKARRATKMATSFHYGRH